MCYTKYFYPLQTSYPFVVIRECVGQRRGSCGAQLVDIPACESCCTGTPKSISKVEAFLSLKCAVMVIICFLQRLSTLRNFNILVVWWPYRFYFRLRFSEVFEKFLVSRAYAFKILLLKMYFGFVLHCCSFVCSLPGFMPLRFPSFF